MKLLLHGAVAALYLSMLWGPAWLVARNALRAGLRSPWRPLRVILPAQLVAVFALLLVADALGPGQPAGWLVAITAALSLAGALACRLALWRAGRRKLT